MLLIIHNLPKEVSSFDVRQLIQEQSGLREVILDNLLDEGPGKRITVGLAEEEDAALLMRKLNGLHYKKCQLFVEDVRKKKLSAPSYPVLIPAGLQPQAPKPWYIENVPKTAPTLQVNSSNMPYYMTQDSNNMLFGKQTQPTQQDTSIFNRNYKYQQNSMLQAFKSNSLMVYPLPASNSNKIQASNDSSPFKSYQNDRDKQGDRRDDTTHVNWRENISPPSKRHDNFGNYSQRESRFGDKTSEWNKNTEVSRRGRDDRSPHHERSLFRESKKDDRRDDFGSRLSRSSRSHSRDKDAYINERESGREQDSAFGRQRDRVSDQQERRNGQKRNYEQVDRFDRENVNRPERSFGNVFETSTTFSSKPDNSVFTNSNRSIFNTTIGSRGFGETSNNKVSIPNLKQDTFKSQVTFPPLKRARFDPPQQYFGNKKYVNPNATFSKTTDYQKMMTRHSNWRTQSATLLAKEVLKNASVSKIDNTLFKTVFKKLRECIMSRLDVIMGDKIATHLDEILGGYRTKFNDRDDINFFKAVMGKVERENEENVDEITGPSVGKEKQQYQECGKFNKGPSVVNPFNSPSPNVGKERKQYQESIKFYKDPTLVNPYYSPISTRPVENVEYLRDRIIAGCNSIRNDPGVFERVREAMRRRLDSCIRAAGPNVGKERNLYQESINFYKGPTVVNPYYSPSVAQKKQHQESGKSNKGPSVVNTYFAPRSQWSVKPGPVATFKQKGTNPQNLPKMPNIKDPMTTNIKDPMTLKRLPKYPNSDKKGHKQLSKNALLEHEEGFYIMEPDFERAIHEEVEILAKCYVEACEPSTNKDENILRNKIITSTLDEFKKIIRLDVTKRILDVTDGLTLRIFSTPKPPPRAALEEFLKMQGAISLKNADTKRMFLATCDSYESYDRLLAARTASFGSITIHMKPFNVLGPVTKKNVNAKQITVANKEAVEDFTKDVDELGVDLTNDINDDSDVMLIENEQSEVVLIRDDLDKSFNSGDTSDNVDVNNDNVQKNNDSKALHSNNKVDDSTEKINNSNNKVDKSNDKVDDSNDKVEDSNDKVDDSNDKVGDSNEKVHNSDTNVNALNEKIEDSSDKIPNSPSGELINKSETDVVESLDDVINEVDEILEDDLEDF